MSELNRRAFRQLQLSNDHRRRSKEATKFVRYVSSFLRLL